MTDQSITALVIEDEPLARRRLRELIRTVPWLHSVGEATNGRTAVAAIDELQPDLVFLDVQLPGLSGIQVLARTRYTPAVIFTTAFDQFAVTAFELGAIDYLLKPFGQDRFSRALDRARPHLERQLGGAATDRAREVLAHGPVARIFVRDGGRIVPIAVRDIQRLEARDDYVEVIASGRSYLVHLPLAEFERRLDPSRFVRIHRSRIVNLDLVTGFTPYDATRLQVEMKDGTRLLASRKRSRSLRERSL